MLSAEIRFQLFHPLGLPCFGTAKVETFLTFPKFIFKIFSGVILIGNEDASPFCNYKPKETFNLIPLLNKYFSMYNRIPSFAGCKGTQGFQFRKYFVLFKNIKILNTCKSA